jgi:sterol desaturase/sphingolipid hydroxylase (fatty acid hydroxylase superfamily)
VIESFFESLLEQKHIVLFFIVFFIIRYSIFATLENIFEAHPFSRGKVFITDLITMLVYGVIIFPSSQILSSYIGVQGTFLAPLSLLPTPLKVLLFFIVADFLHYFIHRLMHTSLLWRIHMWHHSPKHMSWMGGFRATIFDATLVNVASIFAWPILGAVSYQLLLLTFVCSVILNDWMHLNVTFRLPWLEKIIVTPRYHHIHHSTANEHFTKNLAAIFPLWDKLCKTYVNPDTVDTKLTFGVEKPVSGIRLVTGL